MKQQEALNIPLSDYPIFSGTDVESNRQAISRIFCRIFHDPRNNPESFQFSIHSVQLPLCFSPIE